MDTYNECEKKEKKAQEQKAETDSLTIWLMGKSSIPMFYFNVLFPREQ